MSEITNINTAALMQKHANENPDLLLLKKIKSRDTFAFSEFYDIHSKNIYTMIYCIIRDEAESEDLLQEVFLQIWNSADSYDEALGNPLSWIVRIARNKSLDRMRTINSNTIYNEADLEKCFDLPGDESDILDYKNTLHPEHTGISNAFMTLNKNQRDLIEYAYFRANSEANLTEYFNITSDTLKTSMREAMTDLRIKFKNLT